MQSDEALKRQREAEEKARRRAKVDEYIKKQRRRKPKKRKPKSPLQQFRVVRTFYGRLWSPIHLTSDYGSSI